MLTVDQPELVSPAGDALANPLLRNLQALAIARTVGVAARTGIFSQLADGPVGLDPLARRLGFSLQPLQLMLDLLVEEGLLEQADTGYDFTERGRRWLDPDSPTALTTFVSNTLDYWDWLDDLENLLRGQAVAIARPDPDDEATWLRYTRADFERARLIADPVAAAINLPGSARPVPCSSSAKATAGSPPRCVNGPNSCTPR
jgi:hypothetical protein